MSTFIEVVLQAGRSAVELALFTLLPIMVVMMVLLRFLEGNGILGRIVAVLTPLARPFGLTGLAALAMLQITFVSFVAPLPTLALMEKQGGSERHLAAALAAVLAMAPANATFPLAAFGLEAGTVLAMSAFGGIVAASATFWIFGRRLSAEARPAPATAREDKSRPSLLKTINIGGGEAVQIVLNIIPMLLLSLAVVVGLERAGAVAWLAHAAGPVLAKIGVDASIILPALIKFLAGSTAYLGVVTEMVKQGRFSTGLLNDSAGFLLHPLDLPGVAILISAGPRVAYGLLPALAGGAFGIATRALATNLI